MPQLRESEISSEGATELRHDWTDNLVTQECLKQIGDIILAYFVLQLLHIMLAPMLWNQILCQFESNWPDFSLMSHIHSG